MKIIDAETIARHAPYRDLIEALREGFRQDIVTPVRHQHELSEVSTLLLMPAWSKEFTGIKTVMAKTDNAAKGLPTITASYLLIDNATGATVAMMDGTELTRRRTAAAGALAADYLARVDASRLLMIGAGALAPHFIRAHASIRPIRQISIHGRTRSKAEALAREVSADGLDATAVSDLEEAVRGADIISCTTTSATPVLYGRWLKPGVHIDLAGAFKPQMRETDGEVVARAKVYVDTREGAIAEAGDLIQACKEGRFAMNDIAGDLFDLCRGKTKGRQSADEITLFKSCGTAIEDLAAAMLIYLRR